MKRKLWKALRLHARTLGSVAMTAAILAAPSPSAARAWAGLWQQLDEREKDVLLEKLKEELPKLFPEKDPRPIVRTLRLLAEEDIGKLATIAGSAAGGQRHAAAREFLDYATARIGEEIQQDLKSKVNEMLEGADSPALEWTYGFVVNNPDFVTRTAGHLLSADWRAVQEELYQRAEVEGRGWVQRTNEANFRSAYNWVFKNRRLHTVTPADAFLFLVRATIEWTPKLADRVVIADLEQLYASYVNQYDRDFDSYQEDSRHLTGGLLGGFTGLRDLHLDEAKALVLLRELFGSCDEGNVSICLQRQRERAQSQAEDQRRAQERALEAAAKEDAELLENHLAAVWGVIQREAEVTSEDVADNLQEAREIARALEVAAGGVMAMCADFDQAAQRLLIARGTADRAGYGIELLRRLVQRREVCSELGDQRKGFAGDLQAVQASAGAFERALAAVEASADEVCAAADRVAAAPSRGVARPLLEEATQRGQQLLDAAARARNEAERVRSGYREMAASVSQAKEDLARVAESVPDGEELEEVLARFAGLAAAAEELRAAKDTMERAVTEARKLAEYIDQDVNPSEPGWAAWALAQLGLTDRESFVTTRIYQLLYGLESPEAVQLRTAASRHRQMVRAPECVRKWEEIYRGFEWEGVDIPSELTLALEESGELCDGLPSPEDLESLLASTAAVVAEMEAREVALWVHQRDGERCLIEATTAYAALPDAEAALATAVADLESVCAEAGRHADETIDAAVKAAETGERLEAAIGSLSLPATVAEARAGCGELDQVRRAVVASSRRVQERAAEARGRITTATAALRACNSQGDLVAAESAEGSARVAVREVAEAFARVTEGDELFDRITEAARAAMGEVHQRQDRLNSIDIVKATLFSHADNFRRSREAAEAGMQQCRSQQQVVREQWLAAGGADDSGLAGLGARIAAVQTSRALPPPVSAAEAAGLEERIDTAQREIQAASTELGRCAGASSPFGELLEARHAMATLEGLLDLASLRRACQAKLDSGGRSAGAGGDPGGGYDPRDDPDGPRGDPGEPPRLGEVDEATAAGRVTPEPDYGGSGAAGPPLPPSGDPADTGFERPPVVDQPQDPRSPRGRDPSSQPVRPTDPGIVDHGTSAGGALPGVDPDRPRPPRRDRDREEGGELDPPRGRTPADGTGPVGPGPGPGPGDPPPVSEPPPAGDPPPSGGPPPPEDPPPSGGPPPGGGSAAECERLGQEIAQRVAQQSAAYQADPTCQRAKELFGRARRDYEAFLHTCGARIPPQTRSEIESTIALFAQTEAVACEEDGGGSGGSSSPGASSLSPSPLFGGGDPCTSCREAYFANCMRGGYGDQAYCRSGSNRCPACPQGADVSCPNVYQCCVQDQMYVISENRPNDTLEQLRKRAEGRCPPC